MLDSFDAKEACDHCLNPVARFGELSPGELFRSPGMTRTLEKTGRGYRREGESREYSTGKKTAVIPIR